jgi:Domain of unknown function (DUF1877)
MANGYRRPCRCRPRRPESCSGGIECFGVNEAGTKMSITGLYVRVAPSDLERLNRDPAAFMEASTASMTLGWENSPSTEPWISIEKAWAVLGYLLDQATDGNLDVIFGGTPIGEDCGFGPPRYLTSNEVLQAADVLSRTRLTAWLRTMTPANWRTRRSIRPPRRGRPSWASDRLRDAGGILRRRRRIW